MFSEDVHAGEGGEEACPFQGAVFGDDEGEAAGGAERDLLLLCWNLGLYGLEFEDLLLLKDLPSLGV